MPNRRALLLSLFALPLPVAAAVAQPWWNEDARRREWERHAEEERRHRIARHEAWEEAHEREEWERRRREEGRIEWERTHGPYRR